MRSRFGRYSKSETAKCRPVEDLSALNQTSGQERGSREQRSRSARPNPRRTTAQRHTILLLKAPAPLKRESFIFERAVIHVTARGESNRGRTQTTLSFLSRSPQWRVQQTTSLKYKPAQIRKWFRIFLYRERKIWDERDVINVSLLFITKNDNCSIRNIS